MQITRINTQYMNQPQGRVNQNSSQQNYTMNFGANPVTVTNKSKFFEPVKKFFAPWNKQMDKFTDWLARGFGSIINTNFMEKVVKHTNKKWQIANLSCLTSIVLSGFYMKKTLDSKKLDSHRKTTLAVNQGATAVLSAIMSYALDGLTNDWVKGFTDKFLKANEATSTAKELKTFESGIKAAKSIVIFGFMYRFFAPVFVTPIANKIGDNIQAKKEAAEKLAQEKAPAAKA